MPILTNCSSSFKFEACSASLPPSWLSCPHMVAQRVKGGFGARGVPISIVKRCFCYRHCWTRGSAIVAVESDTTVMSDVQILCTLQSSICKLVGAGR